MMKIQSGRARGRVLNSGPKNPALRPILARVKKSVFDILRPRLTGARFLDIFAGTGSVGLEAISCGASFAAFVEADRRNVSLIKSNLALLKMETEGEAFAINALADLSILPGPFDIVFMGPPYKDDEKKPLALVMPTLDQVQKFKLLRAGGVVVAQHQKKEPVAATPEWDLYRQETYGDTMVSFFKHRS